MKALSIVAPSGTKIATGLKTLEIRRWEPSLRADEDLLIVENTRFLHRDGEEDRDGKAVVIVRVGNVRPFVPADVDAACASYFEEGWLAWELTDVRQVSHTKPVLAARGIYDVHLDQH
ncbi:MAG: ASCH domain-containing protein [Pseudomonadota bacterium]